MGNSSLDLPVLSWIRRQMGQEFNVAGRAGDGRPDEPSQVQTVVGGPPQHVPQGLSVYGLVPDDATFSDLLASCFKLRFDERDDVSRRFEPAHHGR